MPHPECAASTGIDSRSAPGPATPAGTDLSTEVSVPVENLLTPGLLRRMRRDGLPKSIAN
ncbi:hypothetical protein [Nocardia sp. NPDC004860]|uniref:hypothetical protein n=1 Tax=Nocardia sp. NPDC004860 TaxID=3154557 RepID=UPI0033B20F4A